MVAKEIKHPIVRKGKALAGRGATGQSSQKEDSVTTSSATVENTLNQRGSIYGSFAANSQVAIDLIAVILNANASRSASLPAHELNALIMISEKMSRVLTGASHDDNWIDMAGYSQLGLNPR